MSGSSRDALVTVVLTAALPIAHAAFGAQREHPPADGVKTTGQKPYRAKLTTHQLWDVVNHVRSIGPK